MKDDSTQEVEAQMERARQALEAAETLRASGLFNDSASRAYYAAFHAASAVLMARGHMYKKHGALIGGVHKYLVRTGAVDAEVGKWLTWLFELRSVGDYGEILHVDEKQASAACERARMLVDIFRALLPIS